MVDALSFSVALSFKYFLYVCYNLQPSHLLIDIPYKTAALISLYLKHFHRYPQVYLKHLSDLAGSGAVYQLLPGTRQGLADIQPALARHSIGL